MTVDKATKLSKLGLREATVHALAANGATVVADLLDADYTREVVAGWPGIGKSRLADLDAAMGRVGLAYGNQRIGGSSCRDCPICPHCGNPRAGDRRHVGLDLHGRHSHLGHRVGSTCEACSTHHRGLFTEAV